MQIDRRAFIAAGAASSLIPAGALAKEFASPMLAKLSEYIPRFMAARNAPGMIFGMADAMGWNETAQFGFADLDSRRAIDPHERFHIGSITKSFTALMILQLAEEGKVKLDADITGYLPGLALKTPFAPVTVHDLLCHSSGLPSAGPAPGWPDQRVEQAFAPGTRFHYCNLGYAWLGDIIVARGGETWTQALRRRILDPLDMSETTTLIGASMRQLEVPSYTRREDDRPFPRFGALTRAAPLTFYMASGCMASTASDMTKYIKMLARRGIGPKGRLLSPERFASMVKRQISAPHIGSNAGYGYGWMIDEVDGKPVIRHTGGMESFMSSIHIDLDLGFGAFASINAQQNYRPVPVTAHAVRLFRASTAKAALPPPPSADPDAGLVHADYAGDYNDPTGRKVTVNATAKGLSLLIDGRLVALESIGDDNFISTDAAYRLFTFHFTRTVPPAEAIDGKPNPAVALGWGRVGYVRPGARVPAIAGPDRVSLPDAQLRAYEGFYAAGAGWTRAVRVVVRDNRLWIDSFDGITPLASLGADRFRFADEAASPEIAAFSPTSIVPRTLCVEGSVLVRLGEPFMEMV
jgi:CubicO group peptidase (beta-lactamase class C family)